MQAKKIVWLEEYWSNLKPLTPNSPKDYKDLTYYYIQYQDILNTPAFKDFIYRINQIKKGMEHNLIVGGLDNFGNNHDDELRSNIYTLRQILEYIPNLQKQHEELTKRFEDQQSKLNSKTNNVLQHFN